MTTRLQEPRTDPQRTQGASPEGASDPQAAAQAVRQMFGQIAPRYDILNHILSMNVDRLWWWRTARRFDSILSKPEARVLDLCCGTGDMAFALQRRAHDRAKITGADFAHPMLRRATLKSAKIAPSPRWIEADALRLPFANETFHLVTSAFGFRNLANYDDGLREILRVLRPGGECGILECSQPEGVFGTAFGFYFRHVLPKIGTALSGVTGPYSYLPASVARFPKPPEMLDRMRAAGFREASWTPFSFGIASLFWGRK